MALYMVSLGNLQFSLFFNYGLIYFYKFFLILSDKSVEPLRISLENIPLTNETEDPYLQFILDPACNYHIE